jgi:hypothetical protein
LIGFAIKAYELCWQAVENQKNNVLPDSSFPLEAGIQHKNWASANIWSLMRYCTPDARLHGHDKLSYIISNVFTLQNCEKAEHKANLSESALVPNGFLKMTAEAQRCREENNNFRRCSF